jgi:hypothetical protein
MLTEQHSPSNQSPLVTDNAKKRPRSETDRVEMSAIDLSTIRKLRLEAFFHPKFENENSNQEIRSKMLDLVSNEKGYLEVTLKHSGSLVLWSGGQRFYSKNSTSNQFTLVAEILLRQHMERAWRNVQGIGKAKYEELCRYLEDHRYTVAFEVVTAVLGDHGDTPNKDYLIATAIADRSKERFLSTAEAIELCQKFRLPHNDTWAFTSGAEDLFKLYDSCRETGLATDTIKALSESAQAHVASMYPHVEYQGEILEGFVIRYIEYPQLDQLLSIQLQIQRMAAKAQQILLEVPPSLPASFEVAGTDSALLKTDLRNVFEQVGGPGLGINSGEPFAQALEAILSTEDGNIRRVAERVVSKGFDLPSLTKSLRSSDDSETRRIADMLQTLASLSKFVNYSLVEELSPSKVSRTLCIIKVQHDQTFLKYQHEKKPDTMDLFRGFCVELGTDESPHVNDNGNVAIDCDEAKKDAPSLMLKMKLLPYMIRTFICRNRLNVIEQDGPSAFVALARKQLKTWSISEQVTSKYMPFLERWADYAKGQLSGASAPESLPPLSSFSYLRHLEHFQTRFDNGEGSDFEENTKENFQGFVYVVALKEDAAEKAAREFARNLVSSKVLSLKDALNAFKMRGVVCYGAADNYSTKTRNFLGDVHQYSAIVMIGCSKEEIDVEFPGDESMKLRKKLIGMCERWRKQPTQSLLSLPKSIVQNDGHPSLEDYSAAIDAIMQAASCAPWNSLEWDARPGLIVFFPAIPGSGKSGLVGSKEKELADRLSISPSDSSNRTRGVDLLVGDEHGKLFWSLVKSVRLKNAPSSVTIIDKNTPPASWRVVGDICSLTNAVPVAVFPDSSSLRTTRILGMRNPDGTFDPDKSHFYPFSLEYLAISVARVLQRPPSTHIGQLDSGTNIAAMVVVMFYAFYRYKSAEDIRDDIDRQLKEAGALDSLEPIQVPFLAATDTAFPGEVLKTLEEAIQLLVSCKGPNSVVRHTYMNLTCFVFTQMGFDNAKFTGKKEEDPLILAMEERVRKSIGNVQDELLAKTATLEQAQDVFVRQLLARIQSLAKEPVDAMECDSTRGDEEMARIKLVAIDIARASIHSLLKQEGRIGSISDFLEKTLDGTPSECWIDDHFAGDLFVERTHVTMQFWQETSQASMQELYGPLLGAAVDLQATGLLWDERVAALEVTVNKTTQDGQEIPPGKNKFVHVTVWVSNAAQAWESNKLPSKVDSGLAHRVQFAQSVPLFGAVSFWDFENNPLPIPLMSDQ